MLCFGTLASRFSPLVFSLAIRALVPAVPRESQHPTHAPSTPVAVCPVTRHLTDLSQKGYTPLVLTTSSFLTTRLRWVYFRSSFGCTPARGLALSFCSNAHHHGSLPQQLGVVWDPPLKADPEGPCPHLSRSFTTPFSISCCPPFLVSLQHTVAEEVEAFLPGISQRGLGLIKSSA